MIAGIGEIGITPELVQQLQKELARCNEAIDDLRQKSDALEEMLSGARIVSPGAFDDTPDGLVGVTPSPEASKDASARSRRSKPATNMPMAISEILSGTRPGLLRRELRSHLERDFPSIKLGKDGVYYYRSVRRMVGDGRLKETKGGRLKLATKEGGD